MYEFTRRMATISCALATAYSAARAHPGGVHGSTTWLPAAAWAWPGPSCRRICRLVVPVADGHGGHFLATAFVKAPGGSAWEMGQWHGAAV